MTSKKITGYVRQTNGSIAGSKIPVSLVGFVIILNKNNIPEESYDSGDFSCRDGGLDFRIFKDISGVNVTPLHIEDFQINEEVTLASVVIYSKIDLDINGQIFLQCYGNPTILLPAIDDIYQGRNAVFSDYGIYVPGTLVDLSGNNLSINNVGTVEVDGNFDGSKARLFSGIEYIQIPYNVSFALAPSFTVGFVVSQNVFNGVQRLFSTKQNPGDIQGFEIAISDNVNKQTIRINGNGDVTTYREAQVLTGLNTWDDGNFHFVTCTFNLNECIVCVDDETPVNLNFGSTPANDFQNSSNLLTLGNDVDVSELFFEGIISNWFICSVLWDSDVHAVWYENLSDMDNFVSVSTPENILNDFQRDLENDLEDIFLDEDDFAITGTYIPNTGNQYFLDGIYDDPFLSQDIQQSADIQSVEITFKVQYDDILIQSGGAGCRDGDKILIKGTTFNVIEARPDGVGVVKLILHRYT